MDKKIICTAKAFEKMYLNKKLIMNWYSNNYIIITTFIIHYHNNYYHALLSLFIINTQFVTYIDMDARLRLVRKGIQEIYDVSATNTWF